MTGGRREAPTDTAQRLATFPRSDSEEMRVSLAEYRGHQYLSLRIWSRGLDGQWWPDREKGCTIKTRELPAFNDAVAAALLVVTPGG